MTLVSSAQRRLKQRAEHASDKCKRRGIEARRLGAHHERLGPEEVGGRVDRSGPERDDFLGRVA